MNHIALFGDSIFDNQSYVPQHEAVLDHLRTTLEPDHRVDLFAVDGSVTADLPKQFARLRPDHTHVVISTGGNDALSSQHILRPAIARDDPLFELLVEWEEHPLFQPQLGSVDPSAGQLAQLGTIRAQFRSVYGAMLLAASATRRALIVCTIYDSVPGLKDAERAALSVFNEVILFEAAERGIPIIDLRSICNEPEDYSDVLNIEPSAQASRKIARAIAYVVANHDFASKFSAIYGRLAIP